MAPVSCSHQPFAMGEWTCSGAAIASHTLMSGKFNELISFFVCDADAPPRRADQGLIETEPPDRSGHFGFFHGSFDPRKNELARGTTLPGGGLMDPSVKIARQVNRGADGIRLHAQIMSGRLK